MCLTAPSGLTTRRTPSDGSDGLAVEGVGEAAREDPRGGLAREFPFRDIADELVV